MLERWRNTLRRDGVVKSVLRFLLVYAAASGVALLSGIISASGRIELVALFTGVILAAAVMTSQRTLFWFVIVGGLVITGVAQLYLPGARHIRYLVPLAAAGLILHGIMARLTAEYAESFQHKIPSLLQWALAFLILGLASLLINWDGIGVAINGLKGYFQAWPLLLGMVMIRWDKQFIDMMPKLILAIAFIQIPFVLHQYLFLVPKRIGLGDQIVPVDVVAGTFGATLYGGGANAVLTAFLMLIIACLLGLWKRGVLSRSTTIILCLFFLSPVFVNQTKIAALYLPIVYIVLFYKDLIAHPLRVIGTGLALAGLMAGLLTALTLGQPSGKLETWSDLVEFTVERQTASVSERRGQYSELSRWTALTFWFNEHLDENPVNTLIGHGLGSSRVQESGLNLAETLAEKRYGGLQIGYTAVSSLLWDTGVLGLIVTLGMFYSAFRLAGQLSDYFRNRDPVRSGICEGLKAAICVLALSLAHKDFYVTNIPYQTMVLMIFGYLSVNAMEISRGHYETNRTLHHQ